MAGWGGSCCAVRDCEGAFLPEVLTRAATTTTADAPRKSRILRFFRMTPLGSASCRRNSGSGGTAYSDSTVWPAISLSLPCEFGALVAQLEVPRFHHLRDDVGAFTKVIVHEIRF